MDPDFVDIQKLRHELICYDMLYSEDISDSKCKTEDFPFPVFCWNSTWVYLVMNVLSVLQRQIILS